MKRFHQSCVFCVALVIGWLLVACAPTPTAPAVDPPQAELGATLEAVSPLPNSEAVSVRVVESDGAALTLRYLDLLGSLAIEVHGDQAALVLHLAEDLPDNVRDQLFDVTG